MRIFITLPSGVDNVLEVESSSTTTELYALLASHLGFPAAQLRLFTLSDTRLEEGRTLSDYCIRDQDRLRLVKVMTIFVKYTPSEDRRDDIPPKGVTISLEVVSSWTIYHVKSQLYRELPIPPEKQRFLSGTRVLRNESTLASEQISDRCALVVERTDAGAPPDLMSIYVKYVPRVSSEDGIPSDGKTFLLEAKPSWTIYDTKAQLCKQLPIPPEKQRFLSGDKILMNSSTLAGEQISDRCALTVERIEGGTTESPVDGTPSGYRAGQTEGSSGGRQGGGSHGVGTSAASATSATSATTANSATSAISTTSSSASSTTNTVSFAQSYVERCAQLKQQHAGFEQFVKGFDQVRERVSCCLAGSLAQKEAIPSLANLLKNVEGRNFSQNDARMQGMLGELVVRDILLYLLPLAHASSTTSDVSSVRESLAAMLCAALACTSTAQSSPAVERTKAALTDALGSADLLSQVVDLAAAHGGTAAGQKVSSVLHVISALNALAECTDPALFGPALARLPLDCLQVLAFRHRPTFVVLGAVAAAANAVKYDSVTHQLANTTQHPLTVQFSDRRVAQLAATPDVLQLQHLTDKAVMLSVAHATPEACSVLKLLKMVASNDPERSKLMAPVVQGLLNASSRSLVLDALAANPTVCSPTEGKVLVAAMYEDLTREVPLADARAAVAFLGAQLAAIDPLECHAAAAALVGESLAQLAAPATSEAQICKRHCSLVFLVAALPKCPPTQSLADALPAMLTLLTGVPHLSIEEYAAAPAEAALCCSEEMLSLVLESLEFLMAREPVMQLSLLLLLLARHVEGGDAACFRVDFIKADFAAASSGVHRWAQELGGPRLRGVSHALTALIVKAPQQPEGLGSWPLLGELMQSHFALVEAALTQEHKIALCQAGVALLKAPAEKPPTTLSAVPQLILDLSRSCPAVRSLVAAAVWLLPTAHVALAQPITVSTLAAALASIATAPEVSQMGVVESALLLHVPGVVYQEWHEHTARVVDQEWYQPHIVDAQASLGPEAAERRRLFLSPNPLLAAALWTILHHAQIKTPFFTAVNAASRADTLAQAVLQCITDPSSKGPIRAQLAATPAALLPWLCSLSRDLRKTAAGIIAEVLEAPSEVRAAIFAGALNEAPNEDHAASGASTIAEGSSSMFLVDELGDQRPANSAQTATKSTTGQHFRTLKRVLAEAIERAAAGDDAIAVIRDKLGVPFSAYVHKPSERVAGGSKLLRTDTTMANLQQIVDAAQCNTPLLLEGGPGVGKSATIEEAALLAGRKLVRYNLCSHTGIDDLIARATIKPNERSGEPDVDLFLQPFAVAFSEGHWLLLDELNLAPDSVLKCLEEALETRLLHIDHPADADFAPLPLNPDFRLFATQNPSTGFFSGKREKLSGAFLNRFTPVVFKELPREDWVAIATKKLDDRAGLSLTSGRSSRDVAEAVVDWHFKFKSLVESTSPPFPERASYTETSLRDVLRLLDLLTLNRDALQAAGANWRPLVGEMAWIVYGARLRTEPARRLVAAEMSKAEHFNAALSERFSRAPGLDESTPDALIVDRVSATRVHDTALITSSVGIEHIQATYGPILAQELKIDPTHSTAAGMASAHAQIMALVRSSDFVAAHGVCSLSDSTLLAWAQRIRGNSLEGQAAAHEGSVLYCDQQRHDTARGQICAILASSFPSVATSELLTQLLTHVRKNVTTVRPAFAVTPRVAAVWCTVMPALETRQPVMLVGPGGCGKTESLVALLQLLGRRVEQVCMTPETEPSELVGAYTPKRDVAKTIEWVHGSVTRAYVGGSCLLLDNVQDANACVMERLNSVLEKPAAWLLAEKGESEPETQHEGYRALATLSTGTSSDVSPALANRFALVFMPDLDGAAAKEELLAIVGVLCEEGVNVDMVATAAAALWQACHTSPLLREAGIDMRCIIRLIDASYHLRRYFRNLALQDSLRHAFALVIARQLADHESAKQELEHKLLPALGLPLEGTPALEPLQYPGVGGEGEAGQHVLPASRLPNAKALAACVLCGYPALLEGSPAVGKTSLVDALAKASNKALRRVNNSDTTSVQDYLGSMLPFNGAFKYQPGELVKAMEAGDWFLADEFNLADPAVMAMLAPLLEGKRELTVPGVGVQTAKASFRFFATQNPSSDAGRFKLPPALRTRFVKIVVENFTEQDLRVIIPKRKDDPPAGIKPAAQISEAEAALLAKAYFELPKASSDVRLTLREIVKWLRRKNDSRNLRSAGEMLLFARTLPGTPQYERLKEAFAKSGFPAGTDASFGTIEIRPMTASGQQGSVLFKDSDGHLLVQLDSLNESATLPASLLTPMRPLVRSLTYAAAALKAREPVLLLGPSGHKSTAVATMAALLGRSDELTVMYLTPDTEAADLLGQITPMGTAALLDDAIYQLEIVLARYRALAGSSGGNLSTLTSNAMQKGKLALIHLREETQILKESIKIAATTSSSAISEEVRIAKDNDAEDEEIAHMTEDFSNIGGSAGTSSLPTSAAEVSEVPLFNLDFLNDLPESSASASLPKNSPAAAAEEPNFDFDFLSGDTQNPGTNAAPQGGLLVGGGADFVRDSADYGGALQHSTAAAVATSSSTLAAELQPLLNALQQAENALCGMLSACEVTAPVKQDACFLVAIDKYKQRFLSFTQNSAINFIFRDGPVTRAVKLGSMLLLEGFDLPAASVTERLNSLLEPTPFFSLTEDFTLSALGSGLSLPFNPSPRVADVTPLRSFVFFATVHRAEPTSPLRLSPAARSRLTEIACGPYDDLWTLVGAQLLNRLRPTEKADATAVLRLVREAYEECQKKQESRRNPIDAHKLFCLLDFIVSHPPSLSLEDRVLTGMRFLWLDSWPLPADSRLQAGEGTTAASTSTPATTAAPQPQEQLVISPALDVLASLLSGDAARDKAQEMFFTLPQASSWSDLLKVSTVEGRPVITSTFTGVSAFVAPLKQSSTAAPFELSSASIEDELRNISFEGGTFVINLARIIAGLAAEAPVLLEGPPGVGKTAVVTRAANMLLGRGSCERINMSTSITVEQLFGSVYPQLVDGKRMFVWRDGTLTQALKKGRWVLFDELNLAPPAVLDSIAPLLRRRVDGSDFTVPGSNEKVEVTTTRFFATMNPQSVGGNRSRLPRSVDSLFVKIVLSAYSSVELLNITYTLFDQLLERPDSRSSSGAVTFISQNQLECLLKLQSRLNELVAKRQIGRMGGPYEFNLRDLVKFRDVLAANAECLRCQFQFLAGTSAKASDNDVRLFTLRTIATLVYAQRFQVASEREEVRALICDNPAFFALPGGSLDLSRHLPPMVDTTIPGFLRVGSVYMPISDTSTDGLAITPPTQKELLLPGNSPQLVHTPQTVKQLEVLAAALQSRRAILLEGDTASRKTSLVRELASLTRNKLVVIPMTQDSEVAQLIGQWLPRKQAASQPLPKSRVTLLLKELIAFMAASMAPLCTGEVKVVADKFFAALQTGMDNVAELAALGDERLCGKPAFTALAPQSQHDGEPATATTPRTELLARLRRSVGTALSGETKLHDYAPLASADLFFSALQSGEQAPAAAQQEVTSLYKARADLLALLEQALTAVHREGTKLYKCALNDTKKAIPATVLSTFLSFLKRLQRQTARIEDEARDQRLQHRLNEGKAEAGKPAGGMVFQFVESALVTAIKEGHWVLLDGINNAPPEVVERLNSLAEEHPLLNLFESDKPELLEGESIHAGFRLLATASFNREQTNKLSTAFLNRLIRIWLDAGDIDLRGPLHQTSPLNADASLVVRNILQGMHGGEHMCSILLGFHGAVLSQVASGKAHLMPGVVVTLRTLLSAARSAVILTQAGLVPLTAVTWALVLHYLSSVQSVSEQRGLLLELSKQSDLCQRLGSAFCKLLPPVVAQTTLQYAEQLVLKSMPALEHCARRLTAASILGSTNWEPSKTASVTSVFVHAVLLPQLPENAPARVSLASLHTQTQSKIWEDIRTYAPLNLEAENDMAADMCPEQLLLDFETAASEARFAATNLVSGMTLSDMDERLKLIKRLLASIKALSASAKAAWDASPPKPWKDALLTQLRSLLAILAILSIASGAKDALRSTLLQLRSELAAQLQDQGLTIALYKVTSMHLQALAGALQPFAMALNSSIELARFRLAAEAASQYWSLLLQDLETAAALAGERLVTDTLSFKTLLTLELVTTLGNSAKCIGTSASLGDELTRFFDAARLLASSSVAADEKNELKSKAQGHIELLRAAPAATDAETVLLQGGGAKTEFEADASSTQLLAAEAALAKAEEECNAAGEKIEAARKSIADVRVNLCQLALRSEFLNLDSTLKKHSQAESHVICTALVKAWNAPHLRNTRDALHVERAVQSGAVVYQNIAAVQGQAQDSLHNLAVVLPIVTSKLRKFLPPGVCAIFIDTQFTTTGLLDADILLDPSSPAVALLSSYTSYGRLQSLLIKLPRSSHRGAPLPPDFLHLVFDGVDASSHQLWVEKAVAAAAAAAEFAPLSSASSLVTTFLVPIPTDLSITPRTVEWDHSRASSVREVEPTLLYSAALAGFAIAATERGVLQPDADGGEKIVQMDTQLKESIHNCSYEALLTGHEALESLLCQIKPAETGQTTLDSNAVILAQQLKDAMSAMCSWAEQVASASAGVSIPLLVSEADLRAVLTAVEQLQQLPLTAAVEAAIPDNELCAVSARSRIDKLIASDFNSSVCALLERRAISIGGASKRKLAIQYRSFCHSVAANITTSALAVAAGAPSVIPALSLNGSGANKLAGYYTDTLGPMFTTLHALFATTAGVKLAPSHRVNEQILESWGRATETAAQGLLGMDQRVLPKLKLDIANHIAFRDLFSSDTTDAEEGVGESWVKDADVMQRVKKLKLLQSKLNDLLAQAKECSPAALQVVAAYHPLKEMIEKISKEVNK